ncbi:MAG: hypothetical protein IJC85_04945 [Oscillospiraceae bacterium]|nr:hypothetical protein [Oscillospiraceae bacterium]
MAEQKKGGQAKNPFTRNFAKTKSFLKHLFTVNRGLKFLSILLAVVIWMAITLATTTQITGSVSGVPITIDLTDTAVSKLGLSVVNMSAEEVTLTLSGNREGVRTLMQDSSGIVVTGQIDKVNAAGIYEIQLDAVLPYTVDGVSVQKISPERISVRFDTVEKKSVPIKVDYSSVEIGEDLLCMPPELNVTEIMVQGPSEDLARVTQALATVKSDAVLTEAEEFVVPLVLTDDKGVKVDTTYLTVEKTDVSVVLPVYKTKKVPLRVNFVGSLSEEKRKEIPYLLEYSEIEIAGPAARIDAITELNLGSVSLKDLKPGFKNVFELNMPSGFISMENVPTVQMTFAPGEWTTKTFNVRRFDTVNLPDGVKADVLTTVLYNVEIVGPKSVLENLSADDLLCRVDFLDKSLTGGKWNYAATILIEDQLAWAYGEYQVTVQISE